MAKRKRKPKYYINNSFNYSGWHAICQTSNNVIVAECNSEEIAKLLCEFLNALPASVIAQIRQKVNYPYASNNKDYPK